MSDKQSLLVRSGLYAGCGLRILSDFTGRQWLFDAIETWRKTAADRVLAVVGPPGAGKTSAFAELAYLQATTPSGQRWLSAAWNCSEHRASPEAAVVAIAEQFCVSVPGFRDTLLNSPDVPVGSPSRIDVRSDVRVKRAASGSTIVGVQIDLHGSSVLDALERLLRRPLAQLAPTRPLVVALDSLDEAVTWTGTPTLIEVLFRHAADLPIRFLVSSRGDPRIWQSRAGAESARIDIIRDAPADTAEVSDYVRLRLAGRVTDAAQRDEIARLIQEASAGNFLYAYYVTAAVRRSGASPADLTDLPAGLTGWYERFLERELRPPGNAAAENRWATVIRPCLELILACRSEGFRGGEIARMASLSAPAVDDFYRVAGQYLHGELDDIWSVYHKSFAQFLSEGDHPLVDRREGDLRIAAAAYREWDGAWDRCTDPYILEHLPFHLAELATGAERCRLYDLLTETGFPARQVWMARSRPEVALLPAKTFRTAVRIALGQAEYAPAARLLLHWSATQRLIALRTPADVTLSLGAEEALGATSALPPHDALIWHLLISVFLLDSGREDEARQVIHDVLAGPRHVIPGARQELAAWCLARLSALVDASDLGRLVRQTLRDGYNRQFVVLYLMGFGEHGRAMRVLDSIPGSFEEERPERDLVYDALATRGWKDVRSIARQVLDRHRGDSIFGDLWRREPHGDSGYDEMERYVHGDVQETIRLCQAILGIRAVTRVALGQDGDDEDSWERSPGHRVWLLAVLAATQPDPRYRDELSTLVHAAERQRSRRRLATAADDDPWGPDRDHGESARVLYEYGRYLLWSGQTTEARRVFEEVAPDLFGGSGGWLHHDIFHGQCGQRFEIEAVVHMGTVGFLDPAISLAQRYAAEGIDDGVRALFRILAWTRRAPADARGRIAQAASAALGKLPASAHDSVLRAVALSELSTPGPGETLRILGAVMSDSSEVSRHLRRASAQTLRYAAKATADRTLAIKTVRQSYELGLTSVPHLSGGLAELLWGVAPAEGLRLLEAVQAPEGRLDREQAGEIMHRWLCSGKITEAGILLEDLTLESRDVPSPQLQDAVRRLRDGRLPSVTEMSRLPTTTVVEFAAAAGHARPSGPAREELRRYAVARVKRDVDTLERDNRGEAYGMMEAQAYFQAANSARWQAALLAVLGETREADRVLRVAEWFVLQGDGGIQMAQAMGWGDIRGDSLARDEEEAESARIHGVLTVVEHLTWSGRFVEARVLLATVLEPMRGFQHADLASEIASRTAQLAAAAGWQGEALQAAELIVEDPEVRLASVAAEVAFTGGGDEMIMALGDLIGRVAADGQYAVAAIGPVLLAAGTAAVTSDEIVRECESWIAQLGDASQAPPVGAARAEPGGETADRASVAERQERWSDLAELRASALEEAESAAEPDTELVTQRRRELAWAYWRAEMWEAESQLWTEALARARQSGLASLDQLDDLRDELCESLVRAGRHEKAIELWREALTESLDYGTAEMWRSDEYLWRLRWIYRLQERWDDLAEMWRDALARFRPLRDAKTVEWYEEELAWTYDRGGRPESGAEVWASALQSALATGDLDKADEARKKLANAHRKADRRDAEAQVWLDALVGVAGSESREAARVDSYRRNLVSAYEIAGTHDKVIEFWSRLLADAVAEGDLENADTCREKLADAYRSASYRGGNYEDPNRSDPEARVWADALANALSAPRPDRARVARYRDKLSWIYRWNKRGDDLVALWEPALAEARNAPDPRPAELRSAWIELAFGYALAERFEDEIAVWRELLDDVSQEPDHDLIEADNVRRRLAEACRRAEYPDQEAGVWLEVIAEAQGAPNPDDDRIRRYHNELANAYEHAERWDDLVGLWNSRYAEIVSAEDTDPRSADDVRERLCAALARAERWDDLIALCKQRVAGASTRQNEIDLDAARSDLADAYRRAGRANDAAQVWRDALSDVQAVHPDDERARRYRQELDRTLAEKGSWDELLGRAEAGLADARATGDPEAVHAARLALADLYRRAGRPTDQARMLAEGLAETRWPDGADDTWTRSFRDRLVRVYEEERQFDELVRLREVELDAAPATGDPDRLVTARRDLASAYRQAGRHADEACVWREALADAGPGGETAARCRAELAEAYRRGALWDDLIALWEGYLAEARSVKVPDLVVLDDVRCRIARACSDAGRHTQATALWSAALAEVREQHLPDAERLDRFAAGLAESYARAGRWGAQLDALNAHQQDIRSRLGDTAPIALRAAERLAAAAFEDRRYAEADALLTELIDRTPRRRAAGGFHLQRGRVLLFGDDVAGAEAEFGLAAESGDWRARSTGWGNRGCTLLYLGKLDEAARAYSQADYGDRSGQALVSLMQGNFGDARQQAAEDRRSRGGAWVRFLVALGSAEEDHALADLSGRPAESPWDLVGLVAWTLNRGPMPFDPGVVDDVAAAVQPDPRLAPQSYSPPFSRAEVVALTLCAVGKPFEGAGVLASALPQRLAGERFRRPLYDLFGLREGIDLDPVLAVWADVCASHPEAAGPWGFEENGSADGPAS